MLKKLIFTFIFSFLSIGILANKTNAAETETQKETIEKKGYSLIDALKTSQNVEKTEELLVPKFMPGANNKEEDPSNFTKMIQNIINGLTGIAGGIAILFIVINAAGLVFAVGNSDDISNAKKGLTWSIIGLILIIFAYVIAKTVINLTYSGENFDSPTVTEEPVTTESENKETDPICETEINKAEASCYELLKGQTKQSKKAGACIMENSSIQSSICKSMKGNKKMDENTTCTLKNIQTTLNKENYYDAEDVSKGWNKPDGKYGLATEKAMIKYYESCGCK